MVRDFRRDDQAFVEELIQQGMRQRWGDTYDPEANPDVTDMWTNDVEAGDEVVVLERDGAILATGTLRSVDARCGRLWRIATHADHRRSGLARAVVDDLVDRARRRGMNELVVRTDTPWRDAVALYRSCGFSVVAQTDDETDLVRTLVRTPV